MNGHFKACYKCTRPWKKPGCHDTCPEYQAEKKANDEEKKKIAEYKEREALLNQADRNRALKLSKSKRR